MLADAGWIASMSRDHIESGLGWSWTPERVSHLIRRNDAMVLKASVAGYLAGFGIMTFKPVKANLNLLAIDPRFRRQGIASLIVESLEKHVYQSGIENIYIQVRETNRQALLFYDRFGYEMIDRNKTYYRQREAALILYKYCPNNRFEV